MIVQIGREDYLNLDSGLMVRFQGDQFARVTSPCGYTLEVHGDTACDLLWHLTDLALESGHEEKILKGLPMEG